jgi:hypothetical protein
VNVDRERGGRRLKKKIFVCLRRRRTNFALFPLYLPPLSPVSLPSHQHALFDPLAARGQVRTSSPPPPSPEKEPGFHPSTGKAGCKNKSPFASLCCRSATKLPFEKPPSRRCPSRHSLRCLSALLSPCIRRRSKPTARWCSRNSGPLGLDESACGRK